MLVKILIISSLLQVEGQITWEKVYEIFEIFRDFKDFKDFYRFQRFL